jgi:hypothetical protein
MDKRLKTAPELERMILVEMRRHAICAAVSALTVRATAEGTSWEVADIHAPGGEVPSACRDICAAAAAALRERYDLLAENQLTPDYDLSMT